MPCGAAVLLVFIQLIPFALKPTSPSLFRFAIAVPLFRSYSFLPNPNPGNDNQDPVPAAEPPAPVPPAPQEPAEPPAPTELPDATRALRGFFGHYLKGNGKIPEKRLEDWLYGEFSIDKSRDDERAQLLATIGEILNEFPPHSLTPAGAKNELHDRMNRWLESRGRENLNLRRTGWPR